MENKKAAMRNKMCPKVSIIMTTYNVEEHIEESLQSALAQDIADLEVLCIDGHSNDHTLNIIKVFEKKDPRVRLLFQERLGIGAAKNCGIENAQGEYITFLDADDFYLDTTALRKMYEACKAEHVSVCGAFRSILFIDGHVEKEPLHRNDCKIGMHCVRLQYMERQYDYHFHSYIYDRQMIMNSDARFAEVKAYDDTHFFIRAMLQAKEFCVVPIELYRYRCGPAYDWDMEKANDAILALSDQLKLTKEKGLTTLHWLTLQRINYEYGAIFEKNILAGDFELLARLIAANAVVDENIIRTVESSPPDEHWYIEPMIHRRYADMPLRKGEAPYAPPYILEPLWHIMCFDKHQNLQELEELRCHIRELEEQNSQKFIFSRKLRGGFSCLREHGLIYTVRRFLQKVKNHIS